MAISQQLLSINAFGGKVKLYINQKITKDILSKLEEDLLNDYEGDLSKFKKYFKIVSYGNESEFPGICIANAKNCSIVEFANFIR